METNANLSFVDDTTTMREAHSHPHIHSPSSPSNDEAPFGLTMADRIKQGRRRSNLNTTGNTHQQQTRISDAIPQLPKTTMKRKAKTPDLNTSSSKRGKGPPTKNAAFESPTHEDTPAALAEPLSTSEGTDGRTISSGQFHEMALGSTPLAPTDVSDASSSPAISGQSDRSSPQQVPSNSPSFGTSAMAGLTRHLSLAHQPATPASTTASDTPAPEDAAVHRRPPNDTASYLAFVDRMMKSLTSKADSKTPDVGRHQAKRIRAILERASPANENEMLFLTGGEATAKLSSGVFHRGPILTQGQQPMPLQTIQEFLGEYYDDEALVSIQNPATRIDSGTHYVKEVTIAEIKKRFSKPSAGRPWNCLELATHVEDGLRPTFLNQEDCRLITKLKIPSSADHAGRQKYPEGFKEVEKWALLAQAGALTEPHQDSHGYSTYITVNQGHIGFGWLSYPSVQERAAWLMGPHSFTSDRFRYVVLKPGQTVYFPAGTVHFVFRLPSGGDTLAFGGHVLRCSNLVHWVKTLLEEKLNTNITNEDTTASATGYLNRVEKFVRQALVSGTVAKWGGVEQINEFLRLKELFMKD